MKVRNWLIVITVCIVITAALANFKFQQIKAGIEFAESFPEPMETVEFVIAQESPWQPELSVIAEVKAVQSVDLRNELAGRIVEVGFTSGETVMAGQLLIRLDTSEEEAQLAAAKAETKLAELEYTRNQELVDRGVLSEADRDRTFSQRDASRALEMELQAVIDKKNIHAPFDAITGLHELEVGQYLDAGTLITRLVGVSDDIWIDFSLPQHQATLGIGDEITLNAPNLLNESKKARIIAIDAWVDTQSRNVRYRAMTNNATGELSPGYALTVDVPLGRPESKVLIPITAVRYDSFGPNVFVLIPAEEGARVSERATRRSVELGAEKDYMIIVESGLSVGERIATSGSFKLREGILVDAKRSPQLGN